MYSLESELGGVRAKNKADTIAKQENLSLEEYRFFHRGDYLLSLQRNSSRPGLELSLTP